MEDRLHPCQGWSRRTATILCARQPNRAFGYDGYLKTHQRLNQILEFLGGNRKDGWYGTDSPLNVASYEYVDHYYPDDQEEGGLEGRIEIYAGNYMGCGNPQGAWVIGFRLFRDLATHLGLNPPRRLKGEP